ncbi:MAG: apolipoprotein N-acyltransferase [Deinococcales bacterium]|nr:apolipoprotein N-acyltransferase [Chitinophagaceae bacterium]
MKRFQSLCLSLLSGLLLFVAWPVSPITITIFFAFIPLLLVADATLKKNHFFFYTFIGLLVWNAATTWWIWNSTDVGSVAAIVANSLLMCLPWWGYFTFKQTYGKRSGYMALVVFWMLFEYIHFNWQLSWPWLTLGNVFASHPNWVQWYEYTGVSGGTLWVLLVNIVLKEVVWKFQVSDYKLQVSSLKFSTVLSFFLLMVMPLLLSFIILKNIKPTQQNSGSNVLIVQPNIDPYQKYNSSSNAQQIAQLVQLSEQNIDTTTQLIIWPETALSIPELQEQVAGNMYYKPVFDFVNRHPNITLLSGIDTYKYYGTEKATATAHLAANGTFYDAFNSAITIKANIGLQFYNKSKLVPGVESLPTFLNFMSPVFEKFGGSSGGYGKSDSAKVFAVTGNPYIAAPVICYESIYGEYVASYVQRGANIITIITNDGWWGNTPGHKQHLQYARLRAIETRRWVARSANTGISAVINNVGNIVTTIPWNEAAVIKYAIPITTKQTFYVDFGDYLYKIASVFAALFIGWHVAALLIKKFVRK